MLNPIQTSKGRVGREFERTGEGRDNRKEREGPAVGGWILLQGLWG